MDGFRKLALPVGQTMLFTPLPLDVGNGKVECKVLNAPSQCLAVGSIIRWKVQGETRRVIVDAEELMKYLGRFQSDEEVTIDFTDDAKIFLQNDRKRVTIHQQALSPTIPSRLPRFKEGTGYYRTSPPDVPEEKAEYAKTDVSVMVPVEGLGVKDIIDDEDVFSAKQKLYDIIISPSGVQSIVGNEEAKHAIIETKIKVADIKGGAQASFRLPESFRHTFSNLEGMVNLQGTTGKALFVLYKREGAEFVYILSPRAKEEPGKLTGA
jgi:hypothetical protein